MDDMHFDKKKKKNKKTSLQSFPSSGVCACAKDLPNHSVTSPHNDILTVGVSWGFFSLSPHTSPDGQEGSNGPANYGAKKRVPPAAAPAAGRQQQPWIRFPPGQPFFSSPVFPVGHTRGGISFAKRILPPRGGTVPSNRKLFSFFSKWILDRKKREQLQ